jgi:beta-N-acetylhexosaminidase
MRQRILIIFLVFSLLVPLAGAQAAPAPQTVTVQEQAQDLLGRLTPEEKVGQLFLVTFDGLEAAIGSENGKQIYDLITRYHVGGVILKAESDNFIGRDQTVPLLMSLTDQLQRNEYGSSLTSQELPGSDETFIPAYIPLFIGVSQDGDGYPYDQILSGVTQLPSQMSLGATWLPSLAQETGKVMGKELSILGINLYLGPSLDVLEPPYSEDGSDLGVRTFGGDPFWVGQMAGAYIAGLHQGSNGSLVAAGKHFPGFGGSDRLPEDEVATVRKTLEQLKQFELFPFFKVTGHSPNAESTVDALVTAHVRYQGFQENFRSTTKPVSFDPQAFSNLMSLPELSAWRSSGGVMISDSLGSRAVRRFYDPSGQTFNGRTIALEAFLAGNDLLYLDNFISSGDPDAYTTIVRTLDSFALKYREDDAFAQRVDASVLRILALKYRIFNGRFTFNATLPDAAQANQLGLGRQVVFDVARQSATLISPLPSELDTTTPGQNDQIVFISDTRNYLPCSICVQEQSIAVDALEQATVRLYSPQVGGNILARNLKSHTFEELTLLLDTGTGQLQIEQDLIQAEWLVFSMLDVSPNIRSSLALKRFLDERQDLLQGKKVVVFAFGAPYYLDATEVSKLTAYYALYSKSSQFLELAVRILFQEFQPVGNLPVSVPGVGYDLNNMTFPDPDQVVPLLVDIEAISGMGTPVAEPSTTLPLLNLGDALPLKTGIIVDHNGHVVPDGTVVRFILTSSSDTSVKQQIETQTFQGVARGTFRIDTPGNIEIRVESDPAKQSDVLQFVVPVGKETPELEVTETMAPTLTATLQPTLTPTLVLQQTVVPELPPPRSIGAADWFLGVLACAIMAVLAYALMAKGNVRWAVRSALLVCMGGTLAYLILALQSAAENDWLSKTGYWGVLLIVIGGAGFGFGLTWIWQYLDQRGVIPKL